ncbi:MAG: type II toxin-antitoxin system prevent-host-death family antitoxin [Acidobacteriota bacterium]|nr:type II toxin-antitoxin system prevent-host-death family antitoxin [Acidobacteriota bacterium]
MRSTLADLPNIPASDLKKRGWRGVMRTLAASGTVVVTNHSEPEAVIVSAQEYTRLLAVVDANTSKAEAGLESLRRRFDERLAALQQPDAGDRLRAISKTPAKLRGKVKAGSGY